ncbi:hypothetical protein [Endozoicomonas sp. OPT23]|nr:hypothetical protein [Endozoicomonas sp. OPT23]
MDDRVLPEQADYFSFRFSESCRWSLKENLPITRNKIEEHA